MFLPTWKTCSKEALELCLFEKIRPILIKCGWSQVILESKDHQAQMWLWGTSIFLKISSLSIHMKSQGWKPQAYTFLVIFPFLFLGFISYSLELLLKKVFDLAGITSSAGRIVVVNSELSSQQSTDVLLILFEIQDLQMS